MSILASGGKTWSIPKISEGTPVNQHSSFKENFKLFLVGLGMVYCVFLLASIAAMILGISAGAIFGANTYAVNPEEGFILERENERIVFSPMVLVLAILVPVSLSAILFYIDQKTELLCKTKNFYTVLGIIFTILVCATLGICHSINLSFSSTTNTDQVREWMKARYDFTPVQLKDVQDAIHGQFMYSNDPKFPAHDVYLKENNGAYYLYDAAGNELRVK